MRRLTASIIFSILMLSSLLVFAEYDTDITQAYHPDTKKFLKAWAQDASMFYPEPPFIGKTLSFVKNIIQFVATGDDPSEKRYEMHYEN